MEAKENTAMMQLIEKLDAMILNGGDSDLHAAKVHAEQLLTTEKQQIIDAWADGENKAGYNRNVHSRDEVTGEQYYQEQFKP